MIAFAHPLEDRPSLDELAAEAVHPQRAERLRSVARRFFKSEEDVADVVQDTLVAAIESLDSFHGRSSLATWLHRILVNECLMRLRSRRGRPSVSLDGLGDSSGETRLAEFIAARDDAADSRLLREEEKLAVRSGVERLPSEYREIIRLRDFEEIDTEETARRLGLSRAAAKTRLHRARRALGSLLAAEIGGPLGEAL